MFARERLAAKIDLPEARIQVPRGHVVSCFVIQNTWLFWKQRRFIYVTSIRFGLLILCCQGARRVAVEVPGAGLGGKQA